jgi:hypothetical protein
MFFGAIGVGSWKIDENKFSKTMHLVGPDSVVGLAFWASTLCMTQVNSSWDVASSELLAVMDIEIHTGCFEVVIDSVFAVGADEDIRDFVAYEAHEFCPCNWGELLGDCEHKSIPSLA